MEWTPPSDVLVGVIGGIGPAASARLLQYVVELKPCKRDDEHVPLLIYNNPQIPNNNQAVLGSGPPSLPAMIYTANVLANAGVSHIILPCNTAHAFATELQAAIQPLPFINMLTLTVRTIQNTIIITTTGSSTKRRIGLMSTIGTIQSNVYQKAFAEHSNTIELIVPNGTSQENIQQCITRIKAGDDTAGESSLQTILLREAQTLIDMGVDIIIIGCTELPLVLTPRVCRENVTVPVVDPMRELALEVIRISAYK